MGRAPSIEGYMLLGLRDSYAYFFIFIDSMILIIIIFRNVAILKFSCEKV